MAKRERITRNWTDGVLTFVDADSGKTLREYDSAKLSETILRIALGHGLSAKLGDAMALPMGSSRDAKLSAMDTVWETLVSGEWDRKRETMTEEERAAKLRAEVYAAWSALRVAGGMDGSEAEFDRIVSTGKTPAGERVPEAATIVAISRNEKVAAEMARQRAAKLPAVQNVDLGDLGI